MLIRGSIVTVCIAFGVAGGLATAVHAGVRQDESIFASISPYLGRFSSLTLETFQPYYYD
jgi:hypothetical protein